MKTIVFVTRGTTTNLLQVATLVRAATAVHWDAPVRCFFRDEAVLKIAADRIGLLELGPAFAGQEEAVAARLAAADFGDLRAVLAEAKGHGTDVRYYACASSLYVAGLGRDQLIPEIDGVLTVQEFLERELPAEVVLSF